MSHTHSELKERIFTYIKRHAPFSVVDTGLKLSSDGHVTECYQSGNKILGAVKQDEDTIHSVSFEMLSGQELDAHCSCVSHDEMAEQWCAHAVALLWRASDLGFFDTHAGFADSESTYRMNMKSPQEIAAVIGEISKVESRAMTALNYTPEIAILLDTSSDRLGVQILFDDEIQGPSLFDNYRRLSARALDNILYDILDEHGSWDEQKKIWYVSSSNSISTVLGLAQEYKKIISLANKKPLHFASSMLDGSLIINWLSSGAELSMNWLGADGLEVEKDTDLIGTGPYWTCINGTIFKITPTAARIATIFPYSSTVTLTRSQIGPILEALNAELIDPTHIKVLNPELQPETEIKIPKPTLELEKRENKPDHFSSNSAFELTASLEFDYPSPPESKNIVYLPDRDKEREYIDYLKSLGFKTETQRRRFVITGDDALDLLHKGSKAFPDVWSVEGLDKLRKSVRFADLSINVSISKQTEGDFEGPIDWFDCHVSLVQNNSNVPISTIFKNIDSDTVRWIRLDSGSYARLPGGSAGTLKTTLGMLDANFKLSNSIKTRLSPAQAVSFSRIDDENFQVTIDRKLKALSNKLGDFTHVDPIKPTKTFGGKLRSYQEEGLGWMDFLNEFEFGGILADEMGLGKTVQALALLQYLKESKDNNKRLKKPALVVAPTSVIRNWENEAQRFTPNLNVLLLHGLGRKELFPKIKDSDLCITSYALLRLDRMELQREEFSYLIMDEAQNIKNPQAATTKAAKALKARNRLALTGTPTENRPLELWSIMDFLMPGYLGTYDFFRTQIERPILEGGPGVSITKILNIKTKPFILRRTKDQVEKDLPPKIESTLYVDMAPSQAKLYSEILAEVRPRVFDAIKKKGVGGASVSILAALLRLRQVCNHPNSIDALKGVPDFESGKFNALKELVTEAIDGGKKILLFGQFREMLSIIRRWLEEEKVNHLYLDGTTRDRQSLIDQFNNDPTVRLFLISLKAGGTGLNLTAADTVVIYDPWWNPAVESQAVDRAHRIGQSKTVNVYRLVTENSIEQKIMALKARKAKIVDALINENGLSTLKLSKEDLENLFSPIP